MSGPVDEAALRAAAEAATPGPWAVCDEGYGEQYVYDEPTGNMCWTPDLPDHWQPHDAAFIAAANPTAVLALLDELGALRAKVAANGCEPCERHARIEALIERSSLGDAEAKAARESVPHEVGSAIALAAKHLGRANAAEAKVARVEALADEFRSRGSRQLLETGVSVEGMIRAALGDDGADQ